LDDFLYILKLQLEGRLSDEQITDQMHIYEDYIQEQCPHIGQTVMFSTVFGQVFF